MSISLENFIHGQGMSARWIFPKAIAILQGMNSFQPQIMLALTANSFNDIAQRIQNKKETTQDLLTVLWHAKTTASDLKPLKEVMIN